MKKRLTYLFATVAAITAIFSSSASAFVANPTDTSTWRSTNTAVLDRLGNPINGGDWNEMLMRYGNDTDVMDASRYTALPSNEQAFVSRVRSPTTAAWTSSELNAWQVKESSVQTTVENWLSSGGSFRADSAKAATSSLWKERIGFGLAPKLLTLAAAGDFLITAATVGGGADYVEHVIVAGENKLFGWHIQLSGPFGIFGTWSPPASPSSTNTQGYVQLDGQIKWTPVSTSALCSDSTGCFPFDPVMNAPTGDPQIGDTNNLDSTKRVFVLEPHYQMFNNLGVMTSQGYLQDVTNDYTCRANAGWLVTAGNPNDNTCHASNETGAIQQILGMQGMSPVGIASEHVEGGPDGEVTVLGSAGYSHQIPGQWVATRLCMGGRSTLLDGQSVHCVAYTMTEAQMRQYIGRRVAPKSGAVPSYTYEVPESAHSGAITLTRCAAPCTDAVRDAAQKLARDGVYSPTSPDVSTTNTANQTDCYASGIPQAGVACPDPFVDGYTVPESCLGESVTACVSDLENTGFDGNHVDTTLSRDSAVITLPADTVGTINPAGGSTADIDTTFDIGVNPAVMPIEIPDRANGNEVATDWESRLRASGYTGTITYNVLDPSHADASAGPDTTTFPIIDTTTGETRQPGDRVEPGDDLTVYKNPTDVPPVSTSGGGGTGGGPTCDCPPLNFTPLTTMGLGSKFPFGIFTYAAGVIGDFNVSPHAPDFNFTAQATGVNGHNLSAPYDVNLGDTATNRIGTPLNTYMGYWRDLLSFCMWVGAIFFVGRKLLGYGGGGDPGEAVDEIL